MNDFERFMVNQALLNQIFHRDNANGNFITSLLGFHILCNVLTRNNSVPQEEPKILPEKKEISQEEIEHQVREREKLIAFMNKKTYNPFIIIAQLWMKYIAGAIILVYRLFGIDLQKPKT